MEGKTRQQIESAIKGWDTVRSFSALVLLLCILIAIGAFIFESYGAVKNAIIVAVICVIIINIIHRFILSLEKDLLFYPKDPIAAESRYRAHLRKSQEAVDEAKAKQIIKNNLNDRAN
jgi:ABC-type transport system involved in multi-copper enzyme maturation permease subunit